jgi:hypothetical protein
VEPFGESDRPLRRIAPYPLDINFPKPILVQALSGSTDPWGGSPKIQLTSNRLVVEVLFDGQAFPEQNRSRKTSQR